MLVHVQDGRAVRVQGDPAHPVTQGFLCTKVNRYVERTYHAERLTVPLRRVGAKGEGRFEPATWDEALGDIARTARPSIRSSTGSFRRAACPVKKRIPNSPWCSSRRRSRGSC